MAKTYIYWNLHKHVWSCMVRGRVQDHAKHVLVAGAEFVVRAAGHRKVLEQKRKNVHAFVKGDVVPMPNHCRLDEPVEISYNPYKGAHFYRKDTGEVVTSAELVQMTYTEQGDTRKGQVLAWGVK